MNPYKAARLEEDLTQRALANHSQVTSQVVGNLEVGLYYKPPYHINEYFHSLGYEDLQDRYKIWVRNERALNAILIERFLTDGPNDYLNWDWVTFRRAVVDSFRGFCRIIVFQPSMLREYEMKGINRGALNVALKQCGIDREHRTMLLYRKEVDDE